jgi:hypothetical protein
MDPLVLAQLEEYAGAFKALGQGPWLPLLFLLGLAAGLFFRKRTNASPLSAAVIVGGIVVIAQEGRGLAEQAAVLATALGAFSLFAVFFSRGKDKTP